MTVFDPFTAPRAPYFPPMAKEPTTAAEAERLAALHARWITTCMVAKQYDCARQNLALSKRYALLALELNDNTEQAA